MAEPASADVVVIGSGIVGSLVARKLAQAGASVLILEAGPRVTRGELVARFRNSPRRGDELARIRDIAWPSNREQLSGPQLYDAWCATCHQDNGQGSFDGEMPSLYHNTALGRPSSNNLVLVTLDGIHRRRDTVLPMPGFGEHLADHQLATLGNWLLARYGNPAAKVTDDQVRALRRGAPSNLVPIVQAAIGVVVAAIVVAVVVFIMRRRAR